MPSQGTQDVLQLGLRQPLENAGDTTVPAAPLLLSDALVERFLDQVMRKTELELPNDGLSNHAAVKEFGDSVEDNTLIVARDLPNELNIKTISYDTGDL
ncbi:MAG: hypothetical protein WBE35_08615, partial [Candidatus Cybelea sp.]